MAKKRKIASRKPGVSHPRDRSSKSKKLDNPKEELFLEPVLPSIKEQVLALKRAPLPRPLKVSSTHRPDWVSPLKRLEEQFEKSLSRPKVSVVIVNHNGVDFLWHCLFALKTQTYPPVEILLVDNASTDASLSFVRTNYPQVKILECQENFGFALGSNLGAKTAIGDLVALLNNDVVVTPDWLARMVQDFRDHGPGLGAMSSAVKLTGSTEKRWLEPHETLNILGNLVRGYFEDSQEVFYPEGCSLLYARYLANDGPFDPDYFLYQEDVYLGWKLRLLDRRVRRSPGAKVFHQGGGTMSIFPEWKKVYYGTRNRWLNLFLFYETGNLIKVMPWMAGESLLRLIQSLGKGFHFFFGNCLAIAWFLTHPSSVLLKRLEIQEKRRVPDSEILKFVSGRVTLDGGAISRLLNFLSLAYCGLVGLPILESQED